jgi:septum site-determining protein MinC
MSDSTLVMDRQACFQFRTSFSACTVMQMTRYDLDQLAKQITITVSRAPNFFLGSPVILDLEGVNTIDQIDFLRIKQIFFDNNLVPVGVRGGTEVQHQAAVSAGIPLITIGKTKEAKVTQAAKKSTKMQITKLVTTPVRSGMTVYAKEGDLIVVAPVSAGAELLADGNIHVYGPLRGRALAGVQGNMNARIFCSTLKAELVAIAGYYLVKEDMLNLPVHTSTVQVFLDNEHVKIETV